MARKATAFGRDTLDMIGKLYGLSKPYANVLGIDPFLAIGGPAEELDTINKFPLDEQIVRSSRSER